MEKARPMREEIDGKVVFFQPDPAFCTFDAMPLESTFPYLYIDVACKQLSFSLGKYMNSRNESTISELFRFLQSLLELFRTISEILFCSTDDI